MKNFLAYTTIILCILTFLSIGGCVKANNDYKSFKNRHSGFTAFAEGFVHGAIGNAIGHISDLDRQEAKHLDAISNSTFFAWCFLILTGIFLVCLVNAKEKEN